VPRTRAAFVNLTTCSTFERAVRVPIRRTSEVTRESSDCGSWPQAFHWAVYPLVSVIDGLNPAAKAVSATSEASIFDAGSASDER